MERQPTLWQLVGSPSLHTLPRALSHVPLIKDDEWLLTAGGFAQLQTRTRRDSENTGIGIKPAGLLAFVFIQIDPFCISRVIIDFWFEIQTLCTGIMWTSRKLAYSQILNI